jgi:chorismate mutase
MELVKSIQQAKRPYLIAGPCSAESEDQLVSTAKSIAQLGDVNLIRAGIWKPRTRPNSFEGLGEVALPWLVTAGKETGIPTTTEVANAKHVETALKYGIDVLWIGARTTVNPFTVQEIAEALRGVDISVMIKNPVNPDLSLWLGAFERFENVGVTDLAGIHRGFSVYDHPKYRNVPNWEIPIAFKEHRPDTPMICDPSHIAGKRDLLFEVSQKAMDLNFEGLMIETHPTPDDAWSDPAQQVTPDGLKYIVRNLILRSQELSNDVAEDIDEIRAKVADLDDRMFDLLKKRMQYSDVVGQLKRENNITILQQEHWNNIINNRLEKSEHYNLTKKFVRQIMDAIHQESIRHQTAVMNPDQLKKDDSKN